MKYIAISLIMTFSYILPLFSQNNQNEGRLNKLDSLATENNLVHSYILKFVNDDLVFPRLKIPISHFNVPNAYPFEANTISQYKVLTTYNSYNFLLQLGIKRNQPLLNDFNKTQTNRIFNRFYINFNLLCYKFF